MSRPFSLRSALMNAWMYPGLALLTACSAVLFAVLDPLNRLLSGMGRGESARLFIWLYGRAWMLLVRPFAYITRENLDVVAAGKPAILVCNHLSFFDIYCMGGLPHSNIVFTVRAWPFRMFWYAPFMRRAEYVDLETGGLEAGLARCKELLATGATVLFFPEGHRSRDGRMQRFHSGAFRLSVETGVPIIPLCLTGTDDLLPAGSLRMAPARIRMRALAPVRPERFSGESGHMHMRKEVKRLMAAELEAMREETPEAAKEELACS